LIERRGDLRSGREKEGGALSGARDSPSRVVYLVRFQSLAASETSYARPPLTMAPHKSATLSAMVDPLSEDEFLRTDIDLMPTPDSQTENIAPTKRKAGRPKAAVSASTSKITKPKVASRRTSAVNMPKTKTLVAVAKKNSRKALEERTTNPTDGNETEEVDSFDDAPKKRSGAKAAREAPVKRGKTGTTSRTTEAAPKKAGRPKRVEPVMEVSEVQETQADSMDVDPTEMAEMDETIIPPPEPVRKPIARQQVSSRARSNSRQPDLLASRHRRAGSASDTERANDPALRRKLGEMTKKFENLDLKYRNLKELSTTESQSNFDKLRKSTDKKAKGLSIFEPELKFTLTLRRTRRYNRFFEERTHSSESTSYRLQISPRSNCNAAIRKPAHYNGAQITHVLAPNFPE
jgi:hypothetical protein